MKLKKILSTLLAAVMLCALLPTTALAFGPSDVLGSWYGYYTHNGVEYYANFTITSCDEDGNAELTQKSVRLDTQTWGIFQVTGTIDFTTDTFRFTPEKILDQSPGSAWTIGRMNTGTLQRNANGELIMANDHCLFHHVSTWALDEVAEAEGLGLLPDTLKDADMSKRITRAEFAAVAVRLYETLTGETAPRVSTPFTDISGNIDQADIEKAYGLNITAGVSDTEFAPDVSISREQLATMLCRTIKKYAFDGWTLDTDGNYQLDTSGAVPFADDADISSYAKPSVYYMAKMQIINGVDATHFAPKNVTSEQEAKGYATATREQAVAIALRIYKRSDTWK